MGKRKEDQNQRKELEGNADEAEKKEKKKGSGSLPKQKNTTTSKTMKYLGIIKDKKTIIQKTYNTGDRRITEINIHFSKISKIKLLLKSKKFYILHGRNTAAPSIRSTGLGGKSRKCAIQENVNRSTKANKHKESKSLPNFVKREIVYNHRNKSLSH